MPRIFSDPREGRTLALCPPGIGNFIRATPSLKLLSQTLGAERLSVFAPRANVGALARASGLFHRVYTWDLERDGWLKGAGLLAEIRDDRFTHSLALFPATPWTSSFLQRAAGATWRAGFRYPHQRMSELVQHHSLPLVHVHDALQNFRLAEAFLRDAIVDPVDPFLTVRPALPQGMPTEPYFACHPGSSAGRGAGEKRLPPDAFAALIRRIHRETGWMCVLVGGPEEHALRAAVAMDCRESIANVETRTLGELAGVLRAARFFLGNDSGPLHVAAAVGTRCAAYFGPTDETRTGPYGYWEPVANPSGGEPQPRHIILRRANGKPIQTLDAIGATPVLERAEAISRWNLDLPVVWPKLRSWIGAL